jgi:hypothetical protein
VPAYDEFLPVLEIMQANCGGPTCHRDGGIQPPGLDDAVAYDNIVGQDSFGGIPYVSPGDSAGSHIVTRITSADAPMPPASEDNPLSQADTDTIIAWIDAGANL